MTGGNRAVRRTRTALVAGAALSAMVAAALGVWPEVRADPAHRACDVRGGIWDGHRCTDTDSPIHGTAL